MQSKQGRVGSISTRPLELKEIRHAWKQWSRSRIQRSISPRASDCLPVLGNVERPLELEVSVVIVIDETGHGVVVTAGNHARRSLLLGD